MSEQLLPCPFCGGEAEFYIDGHGYSGVYCQVCGATSGEIGISTDDKYKLLADAWNTRAPETELRDALKLCVEALEINLCRSQNDQEAFEIGKAILDKLEGKS
jgi:Lar family restriction alleviation protein